MSGGGRIIRGQSGPGWVAVLTFVALVVAFLVPTAHASSAAVDPTVTAVPSPSDTATAMPTARASAVLSDSPSATPTDMPAAPSTPADPTTPPVDATTSAPPSPAPAAPTTDSPAPTVPSPTVAPAPSAAPVPPPAPAASKGVVADHFVLGVIPRPAAAADYLASDMPVSNAARFDTVRVRFRLHNTTGAEVAVTPRLEYRRAGTARFDAVPERATPDVALNLTHEWRQVTGGGTVHGPASADIPVADLMLGVGALTIGVAGNHSMAANPAQAMTLPPDGWTEQEFTVRVSVDAAYATDYELRVAGSGATPITGVTATIGLGAAPPERLSPGQRQGVDVREQPPARTGARLAYPLVSTSTVLRGFTAGFTAAAIPSAPTGADSVHGPYSMTTDACASCHRGHTASGANLLATAGPTSNLCLTCHDSLGAASGAGDVASQYNDPTLPQNNAAAREYYSHDALAPSAHTLAKNDEFAGVSNRHADCADCHNPHRASDTSIPPDPANGAYTGGWPASGRQAGISGVAVINGAAGTAPTYTFLDGDSQPITLEYQLCLKCHSGHTTLLSNTGVPPSQYELDKGIEFNPANPSFHPVEAAGTNQTTKMAASLAGTSPYKLWDFSTTGTVRCSSCHANGTSAAATPTPDAGSDLPAHTSSFRGLLLRNYRDRTLMSSNEPYAASNFALCLVCHAETPFLNETGTATNFRYHGKHVSGLTGEGNGSGTDIDTAGAGAGNALCSECHFRLHSTTFKAGTQDIDGTRLVNFAPNVQGVGTTPPTWVKTATGGTCTLTCHGEKHDGFDY